jgi:RNA polymerase sigma-70 factor, ECF subfamily
MVISSNPRTVSTELEEIVLCVAAGEHRALTQMYNRTAVLIRKIATGWLGSKEDAEEVALDLLLNVWTHARLYDPRHDHLIRTCESDAHPIRQR